MLRGRMLELMVGIARGDSFESLIFRYKCPVLARQVHMESLHRTVCNANHISANSNVSVACWSVTAVQFRWYDRRLD